MSSWTCPCGAWARGFTSDARRDTDLIKHTEKCRAMAPGTEVYSRRGELLYRKR